MKTNFLKRVVAVLAMCLITSAPARADITINIAYAAPEGSEYAKMVEAFKKHAERLVPGITIKPRCCAALVTEDEAFKAMQAGTIDMSIITGNNVSPHYPPMDAFVLPYIFRSTEHAYAVFDGPVGKAFQKDFEEKTGVAMISWSAVTYREFYNTERPINKMADLNGIKIRVPKNEVMLDTFRAFGAAPIPLPWSETPPALQTGTVQGGDNGANLIRKLSFFEFAPHLTILEHFAAITPLYASPRLMAKLSPEQREKFREAGRLADQEYRIGHAKRRDDDLKFLVEKGGMKRTDPDKAEFIAAAQKVQDAWMAKKDDAFRDLVLKVRNTK